MTHINSGIHPSFLASKHLLAEHREIKEINKVEAFEINGKLFKSIYSIFLSI